MTQDIALKILKTGANVFLTGEPGSGKTHTVNRYVAWLREHDIEPSVTASTGIAATHIGGMTIHSWSGIGIRKFLSDQELDAMTQNEKLSLRLSRARVLIIDEISMLDARTLSAVDAACRALRGNENAFGGLQVVFVGDFFQLPPVARQGEELPEFAFRSPAWEHAAPTVCYLSEQHRQEDGAFLALLASVRRGTMTSDGLDLLHARREDVTDDRSHTRLYSHNLDVDRVNDQKLSALPGAQKIFQMESSGGKSSVESLKKSCLSPECLALKIGARVMFTKNNFEVGYVNGTLGDVKDFEEDGAPIVRTLSGRDIVVEPAEWAVTDGNRTLARIKQLPLRLAWAITVHKSQGLTLDAAVMDLSRAFEYGQGYVALSRVRSAAGLFLLGWNNRALEVHPEILASDEGFQDQSIAARMDREGMTAEQQADAEKQFILSCGGKLEKVEKKEGEPLKQKRKKSGPSTFEETLLLLKGGKTIAEVVAARGLVLSTICTHIEKLFLEGKLQKEDVTRLVPSHLYASLPLLHETLKAGEGHLGPAYQKLKGKYSYDDLRFARMVMDAAE